MKKFKAKMTKGEAEKLKGIISFRVAIISMMEILTQRQKNFWKDIKKAHNVPEEAKDLHIDEKTKMIEEI